MTGWEHFQNGRPCLVLPVHSGKYLSKVAQERTISKTMTEFGTEKCGEQRLSHLAQSHTWATLAQIVEIVITIYNRKVSEHKMRHSSLWLWSYSLVRVPTLSAYKGNMSIRTEPSTNERRWPCFLFVDNSVCVFNGYLEKRDYTRMHYGRTARHCYTLWNVQLEILWLRHLFGFWTYLNISADQIWQQNSLMSF